MPVAFKKHSYPILLVAGWIIAGPLSAQLSLSENFDSMGTSGTTPPAGWSFFGMAGR